MDNQQTITVLSNIYTTIQDLEIKGEKNCSYIIGLSTLIKKHIQELEKEINTIEQNGLI